MGPEATPPESKAMAVYMSGTKEGKDQCDGVARYEEPQDRYAGEHSQHGNTHGYGDSYR